MRFLADENVSGLAIRRLRADGHDVVAIREVSAGVADTEVLKQAAEADLILITEDQDFGELVIRRRLPVSGVVLLEMDPLSNQAEAERLSRVIAELGSQLEGRLVVIEPGRTRLRPLPNRSEH